MAKSASGEKKTTHIPVPAEEGEGGKRRYHAENSKLPLVSVIDDQPTMDAAIELLTEAEQLIDIKDTAELRLDRIKEELIAISDAFDTHGMRYGRIGLQYNGMRSNRRLSITKLIEAGVSPEVIGECYEETKPFLDARFIPFL